ncbi:MAG: hypothetical protein WCX82_03055 [archaeon]
MKKKKFNTKYIVIAGIFLLILFTLFIFNFKNKIIDAKDITNNNTEFENLESVIIKTGYISGAICNKKTEYNKIVTSIEDNNRLICTIDQNSEYLFSWQEYSAGMENKVMDWLQSEECYDNFINWKIAENKRCGRERQKDKIAEDEEQEGVYLICEKVINSETHYIWIRINVNYSD